MAPDLFSKVEDEGRCYPMCPGALRSFFLQGTFYRPSRIGSCAILGTPAGHPV